MARYFITGSSEGLGSLTARALIKNGNQVVLHARNAKRAEDAKRNCPGAEDVVLGDLSDIKQVIKLAEDVNKLGPFDGIVHNAGLFTSRASGVRNEQGIPTIFAVNTIAPYVLTALLHKPKRLVYITSGYYVQGDASLDDVVFQQRPDSAFDAIPAYSSTKLHNVLFALALARRWRGVTTAAVDPGWVATRMGGEGATGNLDGAVRRFAWVAEGGDGEMPTGKVWNSKGELSPTDEARSEATQERLLELLEQITGVEIPE